MVGPILADSWQSSGVTIVRPNADQADVHRSQVVRLPDSRQLLIRPISPADAAPIAASFQLLNEDEVRRRFLHILKALSEEHLQRLTHPRAGQEFVVVAAEPLPAGEALVPAVARLSRDSANPARAEFGILVSHFVAGQGLGRMLMQRLIEWAEQARLDALWGDVMEDNTAMLALAGDLGFHRESEPGSPGLIRITLPLRVGR